MFRVQGLGLGGGGWVVEFGAEALVLRGLRV